MEIPLENWGAIVLTGQTRHPRLGSDRGDARCKTPSNHQPASPGIASGPPKGLTLNQACLHCFVHAQQTQ